MTSQNKQKYLVIPTPYFKNGEFLIDSQKNGHPVTDDDGAVLGVPWLTHDPKNNKYKIDWNLAVKDPSGTHFKFELSMASKDEHYDHFLALASMPKSHVNIDLEEFKGVLMRQSLADIKSELTHLSAEQAMLFVQKGIKIQMPSGSNKMPLAFLESGDGLVIAVDDDNRVQVEKLLIAILPAQSASHDVPFVAYNFGHIFGVIETLKEAGIDVQAYSKMTKIERDQIGPISEHRKHLRALCAKGTVARPIIRRSAPAFV